MAKGKKSKKVDLTEDMSEESMREELNRIYESVDELAQSVQEILLRLRLISAGPRVRKTLRKAIKNGEFDGIGD